jgi:hypothetical protein
MAEVAATAAEKSTDPAATEAPSKVAERAAALRALAEREPDAARDATWLWFRELGDQSAEGELNELFALGRAPSGLDGPTDGILVVPLIQPALDWALRLLTAAWMPWMGKRFDAAANRGDNRLTGSARWPARVLWPMYGPKAASDGLTAFDFETYVEPGKHDPDTDVLVIDYAPVADNPRLLIRSIRDELVEIVPGAYLGKILYRSSDGSYTNLGFFALRPPQ